MTIIKHGLSIGIERYDNEFFLILKAVGKLSHDDYQVIVPMIESALERVRNPNIKVFINATELEGWEVRAAWDDLKLGVKHGREFSKIAIWGNKNWQAVSAKVGGWFMSGEIKYFENENEAFSWLRV